MLNRRAKKYEEYLESYGSKSRKLRHFEPWHEERFRKNGSDARAFYAAMYLIDNYEQKGIPAYSGFLKDCMDRFPEVSPRRILKHLPSEMGHYIRNQKVDYGEPMFTRKIKDGTEMQKALAFLTLFNGHDKEVAVQLIDNGVQNHMKPSKIAELVLDDKLRERAEEYAKAGFNTGILVEEILVEA